MRKHFLLFLLMSLLLPLGAWAEGNIGVQLSTTMTKEFGTADPVYLQPTDFVIISNTTGDASFNEETALAGVLKFKRKQDNEGEGRGTYDYEVTVDATWAAAHAGITVVATNTGRITITEKALTNEMIGVIDGAPFTFKAAAWEPKPVVKNGSTALVENTDFTYSWEDNTNAGTGKVKITAKAGGNYSGTAEKTFTISKREVTAENLLITYEDEFTYQGVDIEPVVTVKDQTLGDLGTLVLGSDYLVNYYDNINATPNETTARLKVKMPAEGGNYSFAQTNKYFTINKAPLTISIPTGQKKVFGEVDPALEVNYDSFVGEETAAGLAALDPAQFVVPTLERVAGENAGVYAISITNAADVIAGAKNYTVTISDATVNFSIQAKDLATATLSLTDKVGDSYTYNTEEHFKTVTVKFGDDPALTENVHYTVATTNNINAGTGVNGALVTVTGIGNYKGTLTANFDIAKAGIKIIPAAATKSYGTATDPALTYTLKVGDETVPNNTLKGTVTLQREVGETVGAYNIWFKKYEAGEGDNYTPVNSIVMADEVTAERSALFTITGMEGTLYLKFKSTAVKTKEYGAANPTWTIEDLEVDTEKGGLACDDWDAVKYTFGDPAFAIASQKVADNATNKVSVTNVLSSPIYPTVEVGTMPFTITPKNVALVVNDQEIAYGTALDGAQWDVAVGYAIVGGDDLGVTLATDKPLGTYVPGSATEDAIKATISNTNYNLITTDCKWGDLTVTDAVENAPLYLADDNVDLLYQINAYNTLPVHAYVKISKRDRNLGGKARTWAAEQWNTMTLPFNITVAELSQILGYAVVNVVNADDYTLSESGAPVYKFNLTMKGGNGSKDYLPANKPFAIKTTDALNEWIEENADEDGYLDFGLRTIVAPTADDFVGVPAGGGSYFKPAYEVTPVSSADDGKIWFLLGNYAKWAYIKSTSPATWDIVPFEGFIDQSDNLAPEAEAPIFIMEELDGTTTAITGVEADDVDVKQNAEGWYTLQGVKLDSAPTEKGIYIKDGKKVAVQ